MNIDDYMKLHYHIIVRRSLYTDGEPCYIAEHPDLPGCKSQGDTFDEAIENLSDAKYLYIESLLEDKLPVPLPSDLLSMEHRVDFKLISTSDTTTGIDTYETQIDNTEYTGRIIPREFVNIEERAHLTAP